MVVLRGSAVRMSEVPLHGSRQAPDQCDGARVPAAALEATQGQMGGFFIRLPYKRYLEDVASVGD